MRVISALVFSSTLFSAHGWARAPAGRVGTLVGHHSIQPLHAQDGAHDGNEVSRRSLAQKLQSGVLGLAATLTPWGFKACADAPETFQVAFTVQINAEEAGEVVFKVHPEWAPLGAARFKELVEANFFDDCRFFRVLPGFVAQFGINGDPKKMDFWRDKKLKDDPVKVTNKRGTLVFATGGPNTRTTQLFVNYGENAFLDKSGFSPIAEVTKGMDIIDRLYSGYGEGAPSGKGPNQMKLQSRGNEYLAESFPKLSYINSAKLL